MVQREAQYKTEREWLRSGVFLLPSLRGCHRTAHLPNDGFQFRHFFLSSLAKNTNGVSNDKKVFAWGILTFKLEIRFDSFQSLPKRFVSSLLHRFNENQLIMFYLKIFFELPSSQLHDDISCFKNFKHVCFI